MPSEWRTAVGRDCGNGGVFPGGFRLPRLPPPLPQQLHQTLLLLKRSRCLNISAFCREAIAEKLERLEAVK